MAQSSHFVHCSVILRTLLVDANGPVRRLAVVLGGMFQDVRSRGQMAVRVQICSPRSRVLRRMSSVAGACSYGCSSEFWLVTYAMEGVETSCQSGTGSGSGSGNGRRKQAVPW